MFEPGGPTLVQLARQALSSTHKGYELLAPRFDRTPFRTPDVLLDAVADFLGSVPGDGLDVCCGTGAGAGMLQACMQGEVVGVDWSPAMLKVARENVPGVVFEPHDARQLDLPSRFSVAVCFGAFGHITVPEQPDFLAGIYQALLPGGRFVFVTSDHPPRTDPTALLYRAFNAVMRVRNKLVRPPFIMYYLNFLLPEVQGRLERAGFEVTIHPVNGGPFRRAFIVEAVRPVV